MRVSGNPVKNREALEVRLMLIRNFWVSLKRGRGRWTPYRPYRSPLFFHCRLLELRRTGAATHDFNTVFASFLEKQKNKQLLKMKNEVSYRNICQN